MKVVPNVKEAKAWLDGSSGAVVFTTRGMLGEAKKFAEEFPKVRVILFTGLIPEGELVLVSKTWIHEDEDLCRIILHS